MLIPKHIDDLLKKRTKLAQQLDDVCCELDDWLADNDIDPDSACWRTGVETYVNPRSSEREVRRAIREKQPDRSGQNN